MTRQTVFYSWQSDLPNSTNRGFIGDALERVAAALRADDTLTVEPSIDRDTSDVPGSPAIADTVFEKIARADIFIPDVSLVTQAGRPSPNPNVLLELGYAVARLGWDRIVMVMNTEFGSVTDLPFDLRGRRVVPYALPDAPGDPKANIRRDLERRLKDAIVAILDSQSARMRGQDENRLASLMAAASAFRDERLPRIVAGGGPAAELSSKHLVCVHAVPYSATEKSTWIDVAKIDDRETHVAPLGSSGYNIRFNADGLLREVRNHHGTLDGYLQLFRNGAIESVDSAAMVSPARETGLPVPFFAFRLGQFLSDTCRMWLALRVASPACVFVTLRGLGGLSLLMSADGGYVTRRFPGDALSLPAIVIDDFSADPRPATRQALDMLWQTAGQDRCEYFNSSGDWIGRF